jgi:hypothetical protein
LLRITSLNAATITILVCFAMFTIADPALRVGPKNGIEDDCRANDYPAWNRARWQAIGAMSNRAWQASAP